MQKFTAPFVIALAVLGLGLSGCKKEDKAPEGTGTGTGTAAKVEPKADPQAAPTPAPNAAPDPAAPAAAASADHVRILATHAEPKPTDPVTIEITSFKVVKADFDPAKVEGGTAEIALDLTSIASDSAKRDGHLRSPDYLDTDMFGVATIKVDNVKKTGDNAYSADASVNLHGVDKKLPVAFTVVETLPDGIRIQAEHKLARQDFSIGKPSGQDDSVADELTVQMQLTLKKT